MSASRQCQSSHVSHENVTQSPNPFQHYFQCLGNFTLLASASLPNPPQRFACLCTHTALQLRLRHFPPISALTTPYAFTHPLLPSLRSRGALPTCLCRRLPSQHASDTTNHPYTCVVPSQHASNTTYNPYACVEPSQHASNTANHPYTCVVPSQHASDTAKHPYACVVPSQHASDITYHPYACVVPS
ncbi:hypothetical protein O181_107118 [Austropuccinia psidii MF-1]|uniref:Uncharacterized protein n=1 Tax=Austropuccinia psidii MF-1 TaxID=1389203 RepID=A0A9Q3JRY5_9BASI|nr:hypothetical protein [Austropuccinia psidii MF-1]